MPQAPPNPVTPLRLARLSGPDDPLVPRRLSIGEPVCVLGRSTSADLCLPHASVSRVHASLRHFDDQWRLLDAGSKTGTHFNGFRLTPDDPVTLSSGDEIAIGPWLFRVASERPDVEQTIALTLTDSVATSRQRSRRGAALSACISRLSAATCEGDLAAAAIESALEGAGYARGAILKPTATADALSIVATRARTAGGLADIPIDELRISSSLAQLALRGETAALGDLTGQVAPIPGASIAELGIHSAVCAPITLDDRVIALLYLDSRAAEARVSDAHGFCEDVAQMYALATAYAGRAELMRRQAAMTAELERAASLREMLAPAALVAAPPYRIAHRTVAGLLVSGDLFEIFPRPGHATTVLFGDATGHGVGAGMLSALVHAHLHALLERGADHAEALTATNAFIADRPTAGSFVSLWAGALADDGRVCLADAGHGYWLILRASGEIEASGGATGLPLGVTPDATYDQLEIDLRPGDRLVLFTDGIPEQRDSSGEQFGDEGVKLALVGSTGAEDDVRRLLDATLARAASTPGNTVDDDATVASIEFLGG